MRGRALARSISFFSFLFSFYFPFIFIFLLLFILFILFIIRALRARIRELSRAFGARFDQACQTCQPGRQFWPGLKIQGFPWNFQEIFLENFQEFS